MTFSTSSNNNVKTSCSVIQWRFSQKEPVGLVWVKELKGVRFAPTVNEMTWDDYSKSSWSGSCQLGRWWGLALRLGTEAQAHGRWVVVVGGCRDCCPPGRSRNTAGRRGSWSIYAVALMASGWDPLHHLPVISSGRAGWAYSETDTDRQPPACPKTSLQNSSPEFYSSFDIQSPVKWSADPPCVCLVSANASLHPP